MFFLFPNKLKLVGSPYFSTEQKAKNAKIGLDSMSKPILQSLRQRNALPPLFTQKRLKFVCYFIRRVSTHFIDSLKRDSIFESRFLISHHWIIYQLSCNGVNTIIIKVAYGIIIKIRNAVIWMSAFVWIINCIESKILIAFIF